MAKLDGKLKTARSFETNAFEVGGQGKTAAVKGTATGEYITASVHGSGTGCDDQPIQIARAVGGDGG